MGLLLPPRLMPHGGEFSAHKRWLLQYGGTLSTGILVADPSALSLKPPNPDSHGVLVCFALPLLEARVSGCKENFVLWPFYRVATSLVVSLAYRNLTTFYSVMFFGCFFCFWYIWVETWLGV